MVLAESRAQSMLDGNLLQEFIACIKKLLCVPFDHQEQTD